MTIVDKIIIEFDGGVRTLFALARNSHPVPGQDMGEPKLATADKLHAARLMRVNHVGEVCAQALYRGQALSARDSATRSTLECSAREEIDHLGWCELRIRELGGRKSLLNPLWYVGSLTLGVVAGTFGDRWSLGFLAETERQVEAHLNSHLDILPSGDSKSRAIVKQMRLDEARHADKVVQLGAAQLPKPLQYMMTLLSKLMTRVAYWV